MLSLNNDFLGYHPIQHNVAFSGSDTAELYEKNLKVQPDDWYYRNNTISYNRNNNGHRCKNIEDLDLDNYILFSGCSHTEGIGLALENSYPYLLSKKLNVDYYNLAVGGTGTDVVIYNLVTWFAKIKKPPKLLIVQWPHHVRSIAKKHFSKPAESEVEQWIAYGLWNKKAGAFLVEGESLGIFKSARILAKNTINNIATCPVVEIVTSHDILSTHEVKKKQLDYARDISPDGSSHMGIKSELLCTETLYEKIGNL